MAKKFPSFEQQARSRAYKRVGSKRSRELKLTKKEEEIYKNFYPDTEAERRRRGMAWNRLGKFVTDEEVIKAEKRHQLGKKKR